MKRFSQDGNGLNLKESTEVLTSMLSHKIYTTHEIVLEA